MKVLHTLICFAFLSLLDGYTGFINAEIITGKVGGDVTHECSFTFSGRRRIFCRDECKEKDILVETTEDRAQRGRYSIEYKAKGFFSSKVLYVSITNLKKSDSGRYRCALDRPGFLDSYEEFDIRVEDAPTLRPLPAPSASTPTTTQSLNSSSEGFPPPSASTLTTTQSLNSSSEGFPPPSASPENNNQTTAGPGQTTTDVLLFVGLTLVGLIVVLSVAVLIFCRKRASTAKEPPAETEYANVTEANRVYQEIREEDRRNRSPPVELAAAYTLAKYTKPDAVESTDEYSFVTAASPQRKTEHDSSKLIYSEVDFSNSTAASLNSAPRGDADNVVYSVPRVASSPAEDASPPLYSTVTLHQL